VVSTELVEDSARNPRQIFVMSYNGENSVLMKAEAAAEAQQWAAAIKAHIRRTFAMPMPRLRTM